MSYGKRFTIKAAMEEIQEGEAATAVAVAEDDVVVADAIAPDAVAETDMIEMVETTNAVEAGQEETEAVMADADGLDAIADSLEASEQTGGIDENAAKVVEVAVESFYKRLGVKKQRPMPALESFGSTSTRIDATKLAIETISEVVKKAWQAVVAMLAKIGEYIKRFFDAMFSSVAKIGERAKNLLARIKGTKQEDSMSFNVTPEVFEKLKPALDAMNADPESGVEVIITELDIIEMNAEALADFAKQATEEAQKSEALKQMDQETPDLTKAASVSSVYSKLPEAKEGDKPAEGMKVVNVGKPFAGVQIQVEVPAEEAAGVEAINGDSKSKVRLYVEGKAGQAKKFATATKDSVIKLLTKIIDTLAKLTKAKEVADASKKAYETVTTSAKKAGSKVVETASAALKTLQRWASNIVSFVTKPFILFGNFVVKYCKAAVDLVETLVNKVKGTKAEAPKEDAAPAAA